MADKIVVKIPKAEDLEVHFKLETVGGKRVLNIRDYIRSVQKYGRGVIFPVDTNVIDEILDGLSDIKQKDLKT